jgi:hypothetical protein
VKKKDFWKELSDIADQVERFKNKAKHIEYNMTLEKEIANGLLKFNSRYNKLKAITNFLAPDRRTRYTTIKRSNLIKQAKEFGGAMTKKDKMKIKRDILKQTLKKK